MDGMHEKFKPQQTTDKKVKKNQPASKIPSPKKNGSSEISQ